MKYIFFILTIFLLCWACEEDDVKSYDGADCIYFSSYKDTTSFSFAFVESEAVVVSLGVKALGEKVDYDRKFKVVVTGGTAQPGINYDFLESEYTLKAGSVTGSLPIRIYKEGTKDTSYSIDVCLVENEYFAQSMPEKIKDNDTINITRQVLVFTNDLEKPAMWLNSLGYFSEAKFFLFNQEMGISNPEDWYSSDIAIKKIIGPKVSGGIVYMVNYLNLFVGKDDYRGMPKDPDAPAKNRGYMTFGTGTNEVSIPASWPDAI